MYVIRSTPGYEFAGQWFAGSETLCEMTRREFAWCCALPPNGWQGLRFRRVSPEDARSYVDRRGHHETPLYRGEDRQGRTRILYARG